jgi:hypothetical protein
MPIGTPTSIGTPTFIGGPNTALNLVTNVTVTGGPDTLMIAVGTWGASADRTATMSGGGLTWGVAGAPDRTDLWTFGYTFRIGIFSAPVPSNVTSGSTLTLTTSAGCDGLHLVGASVTGMDTSATRFHLGAGTGGTAQTWSSGAATTTVADCLLIGGANLDSRQSSTPTSPQVELADVDDTISSWSTPVNYRIVSATGSYSIGGQFLAATAANWVAGFAAYKMASGAAAPVRRTRLPRTAVYRSVR